jgi:hypothetical protein
MNKELVHIQQVKRANGVENSTILVVPNFKEAQHPPPRVLRPHKFYWLGHDRLFENANHKILNLQDPFQQFFSQILLQYTVSHYTVNVSVRSGKMYGSLSIINLAV